MTLAEVDRALAAADPVLAPLIAAVSLPPLRTERDPFAALVRAVLAQQLSRQAADTIERRLCALFADGRPDPAGLLALPGAQLRAAGLSERKCAYLQGLARHAAAGRLQREWLARLDDAALRDELTALHGIGRWSAEVLMLSCLRRPDLFPVDDVGLERAMQRLYPLPEARRARQREMQAIAAAWRPWRSRACRYLWAWRRVTPR